jgi:hypothetical protein
MSAQIQTHEIMAWMLKIIPYVMTLVGNGRHPIL